MNRHFLRDMWERQGAGRARAVFFRSLSTLVESGVPLVGSLEILARQTEFSPLRVLLPVAVDRLLRGHPLSTALGAQSGPAYPPTCFTPLQLQLITVGERTGSLTKIFDRLAHDCERATDVGQRVVSALVYPVITLLASLGLVLLIQNFIFRDLLAMLTSMNSSLPWPTRFLQFSSACLTSPVFCLLAFLGGLGALFLMHRALTSREGMRQAWKLLCKVAVLRNALRLAVTSQFCRALATCLTAGVPLPRSLQLAGSSSYDPFLAEFMAKATELVIGGLSLSDSLAAQKIFPKVLVHCVAAGENVGRIPYMLEKVADVLEESLQQAIDSSTALIQPVVLVVVGSLVGFVVIATFLEAPGDGAALRNS